ncbi:hypothetical protein ACVWWK_006926 [Bradyrhizobium sp. LB9.1b]
MGIHVVVAENADIALGDDGADRTFALKVPAAVLEELRILFARGGSFSRVLGEPLFALSETIRRQRRGSLDLVVEEDARLDALVFDDGVRLGLAAQLRLIT